MMNISFLTPVDALATLVVVVAVACAFFAARRRRRAGSVLGVARLSFPWRYLSALRVVCVLSVAGALAFALATPVAIVKQPVSVRTDAEVYVLCDNSMSMLARSSLHTPTRWDRLVVVTKSLRMALPEVRMGIACFTNRATPHLFPTVDRSDFLNTLERAAKINNPRPKDLFGFVNASITLPSVLVDVARGNFFSKSSTKRVVVMVTDGEFGRFSEKEIASALKREHIKLILVHVWRSGERIFLRVEGSNRYRVDQAYRANPQSREDLMRLGRATKAGLFAGHEGAAIAQAARSALGSGPTQRIGDEQIFRSLSWWGWLGALLFGIIYVSTFVRFRTLR